MPNLFPIKVNNKEVVSTTSKKVKLYLPITKTSEKSGSFVAQLIYLDSTPVSGIMKLAVGFNTKSTIHLPYTMEFTWLATYTQSSNFLKPLSIQRSGTVHLPLDSSINTIPISSVSVRAGLVSFSSSSATNYGLDGYATSNTTTTINAVTDASGLTRISLKDIKVPSSISSSVPGYFWFVLPTSYEGVTYDSLSKANAIYDKLISMWRGIPSTYTEGGLTYTIDYTTLLIGTTYENMGFGINVIKSAIESLAKQFANKKLTFSTFDGYSPFGGSVAAPHYSGNSYFAVRTDSTGDEYEDFPVTINESSYPTRGPMLGLKIGDTWTFDQDDNFLILSPRGTDINVAYSLDNSTWSTATPICQPISSQWTYQGYKEIDLTDASLGGSVSKGQKTIYLRFTRAKTGGSVLEYSTQRSNVYFEYGTPIINLVRLGYLSSA